MIGWLTLPMSPGEDDLLLHAALLHPHLHAGRAQQVSRIHKADLDPFKEFYDLSILRGDQMLGHLAASATV